MKNQQEIIQINQTVAVRRSDIAKIYIREFVLFTSYNSYSQNEASMLLQKRKSWFYRIWPSRFRVYNTLEYLIQWMDMNTSNDPAREEKGMLFNAIYDEKEIKLMKSLPATLFHVEETYRIEVRLHASVQAHLGDTIYTSAAAAWKAAAKIFGIDINPDYMKDIRQIEAIIRKDVRENE